MTIKIRLPGGSQITINRNRAIAAYIKHQAGSIIDKVFAAIGEAKLRTIVEQQISLLDRIPTNGIVEWVDGGKEYKVNVFAVKSHAPYIRMLTDDDLIDLIPPMYKAVILSYGERGHAWLELLVSDVRKFFG